MPSQPAVGAICLFFPLDFRLPAMKKFLTTAPVFAAIWFTITAGIMIEFNRFYPDLLFHPL